MNDLPQARLNSRLPGAAWNCNPGPASLLLQCEAGTRLTQLRDLREGGRIIQSWTNPLAALSWLEQHLHQIGARGFAQARWIGYLGYDLRRLFEAFPARDPGELPLFAFTFHAETSDLEPGNWKSGISNFRSQISDSGSRISNCKSPIYDSRSLLPPSNFTRDQYLLAVRTALDYIRAGDVFQVNLSQRFLAPLDEDSLAVYERLQQRGPALYGAYLNYGDFSLLSHSPELFLRIRRDDATARRTVITRPIKGTRPGSPGMEAELRQSTKDQAELNMIIDLERNDLGRICEVGSVKVTQPRTIERHSAVYHGVATIEGTLRDEVKLVGLLRATFPGGSITGAPKIRAMQIIDQLEPSPRGPYCGAIGWLDSRGNIEFNIAIRTMIARAGRIEIPVGGGIVADSDPADEYEETLVKARALFDAVGIARPDQK